ncbi:MAG: FAD-dependent oxidoreductase [Streptosporangiales bacterium]|nr:FAD-dependent oxidoreductase [Streptosporangiales bacterium]
MGTVGSQAMWRLAARGAEVVGFDRFAPGHDRSGAGGDTRIFRFAASEGAEYVPLLRHADALWRQLERESGRQLRDLTGCLLVGQAEDPTLPQSGADLEELSAGKVAARFPGYRLAPDERAVFDRGGGCIHAPLAVVAAALRAEQLGARLHRYTTVTEVRACDDGVDIVTDGGVQRFDRAVVAAGAWVGQLFPELGLPVDVRRNLSFWHPWQPPVRDAAALPALIRASSPGFYGVPSPDGLTMKLGLTAELHRSVDDPNRLDRAVAPEELDDFRRVIRAHLPGLHEEPTRLGAYMEAYSADRHPLVGSMSGVPNVVFLAAFSGHGFKISPAIGDAAADLALTDGTALPVAFLAADRSMAC